MESLPAFPFGQSDLATEEIFRQVIGLLDQAVSIIDLDSKRILYLSPVHERIWGRPLNELSENDDSWIQSIHPDDRERVLNAALESQGAGTYDEEYRILRPNGEIRWIRDRAFPILTAQQKLHKIAGIAEDITSRKIADEQQKTLVSERTEKLAWTNLALESEIAERRKAETQLREANQRLQKAWQELHATQQKLIQQERLRALEDMAEGVVHRFHDTLIPVFGYPGLLLERPALLEDRAVALEYLRSLHTAAKDATATLDQLQEFCRQRNETETFEPLDLLAALTEAIAKTQPRWHDEGVDMLVARAFKTGQLTCGEWHAISATVH